MGPAVGYILHYWKSLQHSRGLVTDWLCDPGSHTLSPLLRES